MPRTGLLVLNSLYQEFLVWVQYLLPAKLWGEKKSKVFVGQELCGEQKLSYHENSVF